MPVESPRSPDDPGHSPESSSKLAGMDSRALLERIPAITYIAGFGESGAWDYVSPQIETILGFSVAEWQRDPDLWFRQIHPEDRARALEDEATSKMSEQPLVSEYRMLTAAGRAIWVRDEAVLVRDQEGRRQPGPGPDPRLRQSRGAPGHGRHRPVR
jgi:PAS domain S-box-containing protein